MWFCLFHRLVFYGQGNNYIQGVLLMIKKYELIILNQLLDKYEKSKTFRGDNRVQQMFTVKVDTLFPDYKDHSNIEGFEMINQAVEQLVRENIVRAKFNKAKVCSQVSLNQDNLGEAYRKVGRTSKKAINEDIIGVLEKYRDAHDILNSFVEKQLQRIRDNNPVHFFSNVREFDSILLAVDEAFKIQEEIYERDFSVKVFKDSKAFEKIRPKVVNLLFEYGDFPEKDQVLETLNIVKNPTHVHFKGAGYMVLSGQTIDFSSFKSDIALSSSLLEDVESIKITGKTVMTIENLTSFHTAKREGVFIIYLGGFHNKVRRAFIKKIQEGNPEVSFYHFGDIDAGGFYILQHLKNKTGIDFKPYKMNIETLEKYSEFWKPLSENDCRRLKNLLDSEFGETIKFMIENNCKLEQEAVEF